MRLSHLLFLLLLVFPAAESAAKHQVEIVRPYKGAIVVDAATGQVLFDDRADEVGPPASVTKLMTFLVVHDCIVHGSLTLQTPIAITRDDARVAMLPDSTNVRLKEGEHFTIDELLFALMIQSANDAANALAHAAAGSRAAFIERMNAKALELGMLNTRFQSPNGLPPPRGQLPDRTSPRDLAVLSRYLLLHTNILRYTSVRAKPFGVGARLQPVPMTNHNHLLGRIAGCDGLKTGFTNGAGFCLAATAQRGKHRVIAVIMGSSEAKLRDLKMAELIERGFALIPSGSAFASDSERPAASVPALAPAPVPPVPIAPAPALTLPRSTTAAPSFTLPAPTTTPATNAPPSAIPPSPAPSQKTSAIGATSFDFTLRFNLPGGTKG